MISIILIHLIDLYAKQKANNLIMPSRKSNYEKSLQFLSPFEKVFKINSTIVDMRNCLYLFDESVNINRKYSTISYLKTLRNKVIKYNEKITTSLCILFILAKSLSRNLDPII